jgi:hypothetical protein
MSNFAQAVVAAGNQGLAAQFNGVREDSIRNAGDTNTSTGSANAYVLSIDAAFDSLSIGDTVKFKANFTNTGACTINVNGLGAGSIRHTNGDFLVAGDIQSSGTYILVYSTSVFVLVSTPGTYRDLYDGSSGDGKHVHTLNVAMGNGSRAAATASGTEVLTLGFAVGLIKIRAFQLTAANEISSSDGHATGTGDEFCVYIEHNPSDNEQPVAGVDASNIIRVQDDASSPNGHHANISAVSSTTVTLNWTKLSSGIDLYYIWEAWGDETP